MANLKYKTRDNSSPQGKPRVYFCCHPEDFNKYFESISDEILAEQNCAIWYTDEAVVHNEDFFVDLKQMQLFVMPVTTNLLCTENEALDIEFKFAIENHIPVLPLIQEGGLEEIFNKKCGDLQFLDKNNADTTSISYDEKLQKYLKSVLIGDELAEKIRAAFDAYVFLSYRKKDRKYAQELMRLIHKNEFCRDIAIWYDEFLTPGENFNDSIKEALKKSGLFVLTVTPNLVNEPNYIMTTEYPMAKQEGKPILPAELVPTDRGKLTEKYEDIPNPADAYNEAELSEALLESIKKMAIKENDNSPQHNFFIGLAYLGGVDVEVDYERAVLLLTSASEAGLPDAMEKLIDIYETGTGVDIDYSKVVFWQRRLYESIKKKLDIEKTTEVELNKYSNVSFSLANNLSRMGFGDESIAIKKEHYDFYESYKLTHCKNIQRELPELYGELSSFYSNIGSNERAKMYAEKAFSFFADMEWTCDKNTMWLFIKTARRLLRLCNENETANILETMKKNVLYIERWIQETRQLTEDERFKILNDLYEDYATILKDAKQYDIAKEYYMKSYSLVADKINFNKAIDRTIMEILLNTLLRLKSIERYKENDRNEKEYAFQIIGLRLKYIDSIECFELDALRRMQMISEQYSAIINQYRYLENYSEALHYAEKQCEYLEKVEIHDLTIDVAKLLESAYYDLLAIYKTKVFLSLELSDNEKQHRAYTTRKRIKILNFILEQYKKEQRSLFNINKMSYTLADLIDAHLSLQETDAAINYSEEKLKLLLDRYEKTKFLFDAYDAYYDISHLYKKLEQHDKSIEYFLLGLEYEEKEIQGHNTRENQERLAHLYRKVGDQYFMIDVLDKGHIYLNKSLQIRINIHKVYSDIKSAKALYYSIWNLADHMDKKYSDSVEFLKKKMSELERIWPEI